MAQRWQRVVIVLTIVALGGCTGGRAVGRPTASAPGSASTGPGPTAAVGLEQLRRALLTVDDLPPGWEAVGYLTEPNDPDRVEDCPRLHWLYSLMEREVEASFGRVPTSGNGPALFEWLAWKGVTEADALIDEVAAVVRDCPHALVDSGLRGSVVTLAPLPFPALGDRTYALRMTVTGDRRTELDQVFVRTAGVLVVVRHVAPGGEVDTVMTETVARRALEKVRRTLR